MKVIVLKPIQRNRRNGQMYRIALNKATKIGGKKYHNKQYGGGIVFQTYNKARKKGNFRGKKVNTNFLTEWTPKQFKQVEKAILSRFAYTYKHQPTRQRNKKNFYPLSL